MFNPKDKVQFNTDATFIRCGVDLTDKIGMVVRVYHDYFDCRPSGIDDLLLVDFGGEIYKVPAELLHIYNQTAKPEQAPSDTVSVTADDFIRALAHALDPKEVLATHKDSVADFVLFYADISSKLTAMIFGGTTGKVIEFDKETLEKAVSDILSPDMIREMYGADLEPLDCVMIAVYVGPYFFKLIDYYFPAVDND